MPHNPTPDTWTGPLLMWAWTLLNGLTSGMSPLNIVLALSTLVWTVIKASNELTRRRILRRAEQHQAAAAAYAGPYRRATDAPRVIDTTPGQFT